MAGVGVSQSPGGGGRQAWAQRHQESAPRLAAGDRFSLGSWSEPLLTSQGAHLGEPGRARPSRHLPLVAIVCNYNLRGSFSLEDKVGWGPKFPKSRRAVQP